MDYMAELMSIGIVETKGFVPLILAADAAVKAANVEIIEWRQIGGGYVSVVFEGEVAAVRSAVEAAHTAGTSAGEIISEAVIPRPVEELKFPITK
jgi:microcompartment protein CcmL/EutN